MRNQKERLSHKTINLNALNNCRIGCDTDLKLIAVIRCKNNHFFHLLRNSSYPKTIKGLSLPIITSISQIA